MTNIFLVGKRSDNSLERLILSSLAKTYRVVFIGGNSFVESGDGYELVVVSAERIKRISVENSIVLLKKDGVPPKELTKSATVIANSENVEQLSALGGFEGNVITCGTSPLDTLSYTSLSSDSVVVSLNRGITALSGKQIQPLEIPIEINKRLRNIYSPIAFVALRLLIDDYNSEIGKLY